ncbi:MAG: hypothetical protein KY475_14370 [Planctomycetes bacterium]|nr:hypothetical protein [Planctomycetota bacterium]
MPSACPVANPQGQTTEFSYDLLGRKTETRLHNGAVTTHVYDCADRLRRIEHGKSDGTLVNLVTYTYDHAGNRKDAVELSGDQSQWLYDRTYQLTFESRTGADAFSVTYTYDDAGNRLTQADSGAVTTYVYDAANELLTEEDASGVTTYTYDADGNLTRKETPSTITDYTWDEDNRLTAAEPVAGPVTFTYNAENRRVRKETGAETRKFIYDFK